MTPVEIAYQKGYRCDAAGAVISPRGIVRKTRNHSNGGYPYFRIRVEGRKFATVRVHRLQGFQKFGPAMFAPGIEVRHKNGNPLNASFENLILGTKTENAGDKTREAKARGGIAAKKHDHAAILKHYDQLGFHSTLDAFRIGKGTLSFILNKSHTARTYLDKSAKGMK